MTSASKVTERKPFRLDLHGAFIRRTSLARANLTQANLSGADCQRVDFSGANLTDANLEGADLSHAKLRQANMRATRLKGANLSGADLTDVMNLTQAQLDEAIVDSATKLPNLVAA